VDLFCFVVMDLCLDATFVMENCYIVMESFVFMKLCFDATSEKLIMSTCYV
jgi:hypothetical protein